MDQAKWDRYMHRKDIRGFEVAKGGIIPPMRKNVIAYLDSTITDKTMFTRILDVGCGDGTTMEMIRDILPDAKITGITLNQSDMDLLKIKGFNAIKADMHEIPLEDSSYDIIICTHTLEYSIAPYIVLCEINRLLREDGIVVIVLPEEGDSWTTDVQHFSTMTPLQLCALLHKAGFDEYLSIRSKWGITWRETKQDLNFIWVKKRSWEEHDTTKTDDHPFFYIKPGLSEPRDDNGAHMDQRLVITKVYGKAFLEASTVRYEN